MWFVDIFLSCNKLKKSNNTKVQRRKVLMSEMTEMISTLDLDGKVTPVLWFPGYPTIAKFLGELLSFIHGPNTNGNEMIWGLLTHMQTSFSTYHNNNIKSNEYDYMQSCHYIFKKI